MAINPKPLHNQHASEANAGASARDVRRMFFHMFGRASGPLSATDLVPSSAGGLQVEIADGAGIIVGTEAAEQGSYFVENRGPETVSLAPADPTDPRHDLIVIRVHDREYSGTQDLVELVVLTGAASAIPADPAVPVNSLVIARAVVPAGGTAPSQLDDLRFDGGQSPVAAEGGTAVVATAERTNWTSTSVLAPTEGVDDTLFTLEFDAADGFAYELSINSGDIDVAGTNPQSNGYRFTYEIGGGPRSVIGSLASVEQTDRTPAGFHTVLLDDLAAGPTSVSVHIGGTGSGTFERTHAWVKRVPLA